MPLPLNSDQRRALETAAAAIQDLLKRENPVSEIVVGALAHPEEPDYRDYFSIEVGDELVEISVSRNNGSGLIVIHTW